MDGSGVFNELDGARGVVFADLAPDVLIVASFNDGSVTIIDTSAIGSAGVVVDNWVGVGTARPQAALHVSGGLIVDHPTGLIDLSAARLELGVDTAAIGLGSFATGKSSTAVGDFGTAMGRNTTAGGDYSFTAGRGTVAPSAYEIALGRFNTDYTPDDTTGWGHRDRLFVIGNGTGLTDRSDLLSLTKYGFLDLNGSASFSEGMESGGPILSVGDISSEGSIVADGEFEYASPKTSHLQVPGVGFSPSYIDFDHSNYLREGNGSIRMVNLTDTIILFAAVQLPEGATVTNIDFAYRDSSASENYTDLDFHLKRAGFGGVGGLTTMASVNNVATSGQPGTVVVSDTRIGSATIDNQTYHYWMEAHLDATGPDVGLSFDGARITYTTTKVSQ